MRQNFFRTTGVAIVLMTLASCVSGELNEPGEDEKPFIDPLVLSQNMCGRPDQKPQYSAAPEAEEMAVEFDFAKPFALGSEVVEHFHYPISTQNQEVQYWFDMGLAHMANFNHDEAIAAFRKAQELEPDCAMCYWGEGLAFGSNINAPFDPNRGAAGLASANRAMRLLSDVSDKEAALISALSERYGVSERGIVENAEKYADAMDSVAHSYASDKFVLALAAEANMDTQPWDYWRAGARLPKGRTARTLELLETALDIDPDFAPSVHLYIHITEGSIDPYRAEKFADRLQAQALGVGHLLHMPSHTYLRLGRWKKSQAANLAAIAADEAYITQSENALYYANVYYPHNIHFVLASSQFAGDAETAFAMAGKLMQLGEIDPSGPSPFIEHMGAATIFAALQFADSSTVLSIPEPAEPHLLMKTAWHYARGSVFARDADIENAQIELQSLAALIRDQDLQSYQDGFGVPLPSVAEIAQLTLQGRIHAGRGDLEAAISSLESAAELDAQLPYYEPTWWYYPTRQTLAKYLLEDGQFDRAEREFFKTLVKAPNNAYSLFGLAETYKAKGDKRSEDYARELFEEAWMGGEDALPSLNDL